MEFSELYTTLAASGALDSLSGVFTLLVLPLMWHFKKSVTMQLISIRDSIRNLPCNPHISESAESTILSTHAHECKNRAKSNGLVKENIGV